MSETSTNWTDTSINSTNYSDTSINSTNWDDDATSRGILLLETGDYLLMEDGSNIALQ